MAKAAPEGSKKPAAAGNDKRLQVATRGPDDEAPAVSAATKGVSSNLPVLTKSSPAAAEKELKQLVDRGLNYENLQRDVELIRKSHAPGGLSPEEYKVLMNDKDNIQKAQHAFADLDELSTQPEKQSRLLNIHMIKNSLATDRAYEASVQENFDVWRQAGMISAGFVTADAAARAAANAAIQKGPPPVAEVAAVFLGARNGMQAALEAPKVAGEVKDRAVELKDKYREMKKTVQEYFAHETTEKLTGESLVQLNGTPGQKTAARSTSTSLSPEQKQHSQTPDVDPAGPVGPAPTQGSGKEVIKATIETGKAGVEFAKSGKEFFDKPSEAKKFLENLVDARLDRNKLPNIADELVKETKKVPSTLARVGAAAGAVGDGMDIWKKYSKQKDNAGAAQSGFHMFGKLVTVSGRAGGEAMEGAGDAVKGIADFNEASSLTAPVRGFAANELQAKLETREQFLRLKAEFNELKHHEIGSPEEIHVPPRLCIERDGACIPLDSVAPLK